MQFLERCTLRTKLLLGFVVLMGLALALGVSDLLTQRTLVQQISQLYEQDLLGISNAKDAQAAYVTMGRELRQALIAQTQEDRDIAVRHIAEQDGMLRLALSELGPRVIRTDNQQRLTRFKEAYAVYWSNVDQALNVLARGELEQARSFVASHDFQATGDAVRARMDEVVAGKEGGALQSRVSALRVARQARDRGLVLLIGGALLAGVIYWLVAASIRRPGRRVRDALEQLAKGNLSVEVPHQDFGNEFGELARSVHVLQQVAQQMQNQNWLKSHLAGIANALQTAADPADLSRSFFAQLAAIVQIGQGTLYGYEDDTRELLPLGVHPDRELRASEQRVGPGHGMARQCAIDRVAVVQSHVPATGIDAGSGALAVFPLLRGERLLGVLELATFAPFGARERALLDELVPVLAMNLEILERTTRANTLLQETQRQAGAMREQARVLAQQAGELVAQKDAIQATETWYRGIIESAPDGLLVLDTEGRIIFANPQVEKIFGYDSGELAGQAIETLVPPSARGVHVGLRTAFARDGSARIMGAGGKRLKGLRKDGTEFPVEVGLARLPDVDGRGDCVCASVRDVTDRLEAELALGKSAERLNFALHGGQLGMWDWDVASGRSEVNEIWAGMLGYTLDEVNEDGDAAASWERLLHPDDSANAHQSFARCIEDPGTPEYQALFRMRAKAGDWRWILSMGRATERDPQGRALRLVGIHQDFTERKRLQDDMARATAVAEEATRAKSDFLANMSHEIRTPMNAIIGMAYLALQTGLDPRQRNYIEKVHRAGQNLLGIINDILDFSKIEAGKLSLERTDFRLEDVMDNLASMVGMKAEDKGLELLFAVDPEVPTTLVGDPLRLGQVLVNLGNNAVKFTERGEVVVTVRLAGREADSVELHFGVRDTGIGLDAEQSGQLFQSFSQADSSITRRYGGTGLGLAICKDLVALMDGRIWVDSVPGHGSTFQFLARFGVKAVTAPRQAVPPEALRGVRALVVDDNAAAREILAGMARQHGLEADVARDGEEALEMVQSGQQRGGPYDVVLMDWKMPVMDGVETAARLHERLRKDMPSVIMVTAFGREEALAAADQRRVQLQAVLTKPVTAAGLLRAIAQALGRSVPREETADGPGRDYDDAVAALRGARVLLVEDNDLNQELAGELLQRAGIAFALAGNGREALDVLARDPHFDGVLMDCQMPVMDGYAATQAIRADSRWARLPVIAMTANVMAGAGERERAAGMDDRIAKPLDLRSMFATMARWIRPQGGATPALPAAPAAPAVSVPVSELPALAGIDVQRGLATSGGDLGLYRRLLSRFIAGQADFGARFRAALQSADPAGATRIAHTLKGTAGNIGAREVQAAAGALEHACLDGLDPAAMMPLLGAAEQALDSVLAGLASVVEATEAAPPATLAGPPGPELAALVGQLRALLQADDSAAAELVDPVVARARGTSWEPALQRAGRAIADFDFDAALAALAELER